MQETRDKLKVLLVDDSDDDWVLFEYALRKAAVRWNVVARVEDGAEAIHYLEGAGKYADRAAFPYPDLLLLDLKMPKRMGFEVLAWMRKQPERPFTVVLSGSNRYDDVKQALALGADHYQIKPNNVLDFVGFVRGLDLLLERTFLKPMIGTEFGEVGTA